jgi:hypothetical protein
MARGTALREFQQKSSAEQKHEGFGLVYANRIAGGVSYEKAIHLRYRAGAVHGHAGHVGAERQS